MNWIETFFGEKPANFSIWYAYLSYRYMKRKVVDYFRKGYRFTSVGGNMPDARRFTVTLCPMEEDQFGVTVLGEDIE